jgi:hypothetical protein
MPNYVRAYPVEHMPLPDVHCEGPSIHIYLNTDFMSHWYSTHRGNNNHTHGYLVTMSILTFLAMSRSLFH